MTKQRKQSRNLLTNTSKRTYALAILMATVLVGCSQEPTTSYLECKLLYKYGGSIEKNRNENHQTDPMLSSFDDSQPKEVIIDTVNKEIRMFWNIDYVFNKNYINNRDIISAEDPWIAVGETEIFELNTFELDKASGKAYWKTFWPDVPEDNNNYIRELECTKKQPIL